MNILAVNTCFNKSYVAIKSNDNLICKEMDSSLKQSENILGLIDNALSELNISIQNINCVACVIGPGSFTGIRIGASLCKGFCTANKNTKRIPICSLDLVAYSFAKSLPSSEYWVVLNALSGNLFIAKYDKNGKRIIDPMLASQDNLNVINGLVVGITDENLEICNNNIILSSNDLIEFAIKNEKTTEGGDFIPLYLRKSQAESELDKKDANC